MKIDGEILTIIMLITLAACGNSNDEPTNSEGAIVTFLVAGREEYKI
jgi:hypothetical protein